jgi:hypothetical protein
VGKLVPVVFKPYIERASEHIYPEVSNKIYRFVKVEVFKNTERERFFYCDLVVAASFRCE